MVFSGKYNHTINANGRVSVPSKFRDSLKFARSEDKVVLVRTPKCVKAYPTEAWEAFFNSLPDDTESDAREKRRVSARSTEAEIDKNGRILLPPEFREYFSNECVFIGLGKDRFEIWDNGAWQEMDEGKADNDNLSPIYKQLYS
jgi:MraZ protein